ncbi:hypothetical protein SK128_023040, partial [Halocaridina rubra]
TPMDPSLFSTNPPTIPHHDLSNPSPNIDYPSTPLPRPTPANDLHPSSNNTSLPNPRPPILAVKGNAEPP